MDGCIVTLEETPPIMIEMFHHSVKVITRNNFVLISSDRPLYGGKWTKIMPAKGPQQHIRATRSPQLRGQGFRCMKNYLLSFLPSIETN